MGLYRKIVDECVELGIEHVRMHNYGEPFVDRQLVEKVRYAKERGIPEVGMISNGSLITDAGRARHDRGGPRRDQHQRGRVRAGRCSSRTRIGLKYDKVIANIERLRAASARELGRTRPKLILSFVRQNNSADEAGVHRALAGASPTRSTSPTSTTGPARSTSESDVNFPCYRQWLTFTVLWDGRVALCCADFDGKVDPRRPQDVVHPRDLEQRALPCASGARTSRAAARTSAGRATFPARTPRSGLPSWPRGLSWLPVWGRRAYTGSWSCALPD